MGIQFVSLDGYRKKMDRHSEKMIDHRKEIGGHYADSKHSEVVAGIPCD